MFLQNDANTDILSLGIAVSGKFIMTCDSKNRLVIWDLHGEIYETIDTRHGDTYSATLSHCGRYIGTTGINKTL